MHNSFRVKCSKLSEKKSALSNELCNLESINRSINELGGLDNDREKNIQFIQKIWLQIPNQLLDMSLQQTTNLSVVKFSCLQK